MNRYLGSTVAVVRQVLDVAQRQRNFGLRSLRAEFRLRICIVVYHQLVIIVRVHVKRHDHVISLGLQIAVIIAPLCRTLLGDRLHVVRHRHLLINRNIVQAIINALNIRFRLETLIGRFHRNPGAIPFVRTLGCHGKGHPRGRRLDVRNLELVGNVRSLGRQELIINDFLILRKVVSRHYVRVARRKSR